MVCYTVCYKDLISDFIFVVFALSSGSKSFTSVVWLKRRKIPNVNEKKDNFLLKDLDACRE